MEIIMFIAMLLIGSLFNSGKRKAKHEEKQQPKPFTAGQKEPDNPIKKLKEMSRDLYKEIQQEFEVEQGKPKQKSEPQHTVPARDVVQQVEVAKPKRQPVEKRQPKEAAQSKVVKKQKKKSVKKKALMPTSSNDIMTGIIFSEIIGPPKSKR